MSIADELFELTGPQKLVWINEHLFPGTSLHTLAGAAVFRGAIDEARLTAAVAAFIADNSALRTALHVVDGEPRQSFPDAPATVARLDFSGEPRPAAAFRRWAEAGSRRPISILGGPLYEAAVAHLGPDGAALHLRVHHIIADGYALFMFLEGVARNYAQLVDAGAIATPARSSYELFVASERAYRGSAQYSEDRARWTAALDAVHAPARLRAGDLTAAPTDAVRKTYRFGAGPTGRLAAVCHELRASPFAVVAAVLASVLARMSGSAQVCLGTPILNRRSPRERTTFGMFVNTIPLPFTVDRAAGLGSLVGQAGRLTRAAVVGSRFPVLGLRRSGSPDLFDVGLSYQNAAFRPTYGGVEVDLEWFFSGHEMNAATVHFHDRQGLGELTFDIDYRTCAISERLVDGLAEALARGIEDAGDESGRRRAIGSLPLTSAVPTVLTAQPHGEAPPLLAPVRVQAIMAAYADRPALSWPGGTWTYAELAAEADARCAALRAAGVGPGDRVAIVARRAPETVASILAAWAAGAAYVPIDPRAPAARVAEILADAAARVLVDRTAPPFGGADGRGQARAVGDGDGMAVLDLAHARADLGRAPWHATRPHELCYVIFTSGSTGRPKGVAVDHAGLAHYLEFAVARYANGQPTSCPLFTSLAFDLTVTSLFLPLVTGGCLAIHGEDDEHDGAMLARVVADERSEVIKLTPSHLALVAGMAPGPHVRAYVVGGEALPARIAGAVFDAHGGRVEIINEYGPTEAVVGCTTHTYRPADAGGDVAIGLPIPGTALRIVTPWGLDQIAGGEGELLIGGRGLAVGYVGRDDLTGERFVADRPGGPRWYRTGDVVRLRPDGALDYLGRADRQIKIRGFRIELGEIEAAYRAAVADEPCVAIDLDGAAGQRLLVLFHAAVAEPATRDARVVRAALAGRLPDYMVPSVILPIDAIPLGDSGKLDRAALQRRLDEVHARAPAPGAPADLSPAAIRALALIQPLLGGAVDVRQSFLDAGGDSITAIQAVSRLQANGLGGSVRALLRSDSIAGFLAGLGDAAAPPARAPATGPLAHPPPAARWFLAQHFERAEHWHQSVLLRPRSSLDPALLAEALRAVVRVHDALRLNLAEDGRTLWFNPAHLEVAPPVAVRALAGGEARPAALVAAAQDLKRGFDLGRDLLLKAALLDDGDDARLLLVGHHLVVDVVSWHILIADLGAAYAALAAGREPALAPEPTSFAEWCAALAELDAQLAAPRRARARESARQARSLPPVPARPRDPDAPGVLTMRLELGGEAGALLGDANRAFGTRPHELVLAAAVAATARHFGRDAVSVEYESHGRHELARDRDLSRTVGWLTAMSPLVFGARPADRHERLVIAAKDRLRGLAAPGMGAPVDRTAPPFGGADGRGQAPAVDGEADSHPMLRFNYLGQATAAIDPGGLFELAPEPTGPDVSPANHASASIELIAEASGAGIAVTLHLDARCFDPASADRFAADLIDEARAVARLCLAREGTRSTPSDFPAAELTLEELDSLITG